MIKNLIKKLKNWIIAILGISVCLAAGTQFLPEKIIVEYDYPQGKLLKAWTKPTTDKGWAEDVKEESFNVKHDYQLDQMEENLTEKLPKVQKDLDKFIQCPECIKWELTERFKQLEYNKKGLSEGKTLQQWVEEDFQSQLSYYQWKTGKIKQSLKRIVKEKELRATKKVNRKDEIVGTTLYIDSSDCVNVLAGTWTFTSASVSVNGTDGDAGVQLAVGSHIKSSSGDTTQWYTVSTSTANLITLTATYLGTTATDTASTTCRNVNSGLAITTVVAYGATSTGPYSVLDQFTEVARAAGDKVIIRRGTTAKIDDRTDTNFTSNGTIVAPLVIEADYDNVWADYTTSTADTATLTFGSKTITMTATTGIAVGNWIYNITDSDNPREYAYEVATVGATGITLYLPFKGTTGSSKTLRIMPANPQWNIAAGDFQWNFDGDNYWKVQGMDIRGTDANGAVEVDSTIAVEFVDTLFITNTTDYCLTSPDSVPFIIFNKNRCDGRFGFGGNGGLDIIINNSYFSGTGESADSFPFLSSAIYGGRSYFVNETEIVDFTAIINTSASYAAGPTRYVFRNLKLTNITQVYDDITDLTLGTGRTTLHGFEDYNGIIGDNRSFSAMTSIVDSESYKVSTSTTVRAGGGNTSMEITPTVNLGTAMECSRLQLFEYPIYADTTSKTYSVYFMSPTTTAWTADPLATELWIECEYWGHATNNHRRLTKSTGTLDFNGTTTWNALSVTCQPSQNGILYLRGFYAKTKEAGTNIFFADVQPIIQ